MNLIVLSRRHFLSKIREPIEGLLNIFPPYILDTSLVRDRFRLLIIIRNKK